MISLKNVSKEYSAGIPAVKNVNLQIEDGEFVFIVGNSGSGKSTLIKLLLKELEPTEGTVVVNDIELNNLKHKNIPKFRREIGVVFQDFRLLKDRSIYENVAFAQRIIERPPKKIKKRVPEMLKLGRACQRNTVLFQKNFQEVQQQRVAVAESAYK